MSWSFVIPRNAVVLGATGAVGGHIVRALLQSSLWNSVTTLGRRLDPAWEEAPENLIQCLTDVFAPEAYAGAVEGCSHAFCAFGLGRPSKFPPEEFQRVDMDAVLRFAATCRKHGVGHFTVMTTVGAHPGSPFRYLRRKGELEREIAAMGFTRTSFFRPSLLMTPANRYGRVHGFLLRAMPVFDRFLAGPWRRYRGIPVAALGEAMVRNAEQPGRGSEWLEWDDFQAVLEGREIPRVFGPVR